MNNLQWCSSRITDSDVQIGDSVGLHPCCCQSLYEQWTHGQLGLKHERFWK